MSKQVDRPLEGRAQRFAAGQLSSRRHGQPLSNLKATPAVDPRQAFGTDTISIAYSVTNTSDYNFKRSSTEITVLGHSARWRGCGPHRHQPGHRRWRHGQGHRPGKPLRHAPRGAEGLHERRSADHLGYDGNMYPAEVPITVKG